jgi:predicted glutamine amidotransferase
MCVILAVPEGAKNITAQEWDQATASNSDGYGIAWLDDGMVRFTKLGYNESKKLREWRPPQPYIMHFRLATIGAEVPELCHPFIVSPKSKLAVRGRAHEVLFHNGHWSDWAEWLAITYSGVGKLPSGPFSDSRAMASMVGNYGHSILDISGATGFQKIALFNKLGEFTFLGNGWCEGDDGVHRSNEGHLWTYGDHYYSAAESEWLKQESLRNEEGTKRTADCCVCQETYLTYQEDEDGMCYRCDNWGGTAYTEPRVLPTTTKELEEDKHCFGCGMFLDKSVNGRICIECKPRLDKTLKCKVCDKPLWMEASIASQCCGGCRKNPDHRWWQTQANLWFAIKHHLKGWAVLDKPVFIMCATFGVWEEDDGSGFKYCVVGHTGHGDLKESLFFEGTVSKDFKTITSGLIEWDKDEDDIRKAMLVRF